jgi:hypothetical protein
MERITSFLAYAVAMFLAWIGKYSPQDIAFMVGAAVGVGTLPAVEQVGRQPKGLR